MKKNDSNSIFLEDIFAQFSHEIENDTQNIGFLKYIGNEIVDCVREINKSHLQIYKSLDLLKAKQNNICKFIINLNKNLIKKNFSLNDEIEIKK